MLSITAGTKGNEYSPDRDVKRYENVKEPEKPGSYYRTYFLFCQISAYLVVEHVTIFRLA